MSKEDVGTNAGIIWHLLSEKGELDIRKIGEFTSLGGSAIILSLGWLAREDKIKFSNKNGTLYFSLLSVPSEMFY